jgi:bifunctional DNA-binding transcriptional regulator/antitoxin component of YhaV-PrlF toxin-antitoxin module
MSTMTVQMRRKGAITLPVDLRRRYGLDESDVFTLEDLGNGSFLLIAQSSQVARFGDRVAEAMEEEGIGLDEMLKVLDEERESYYRAHYVRA